MLHQFDLGADGVIMHGADPGELAPVVQAYRRVRPPGRFEDLAANPGAATPDGRRSATAPGPDGQLGRFDGTGAWVVDIDGHRPHPGRTRTRTRGLDPTGPEDPFLLPYPA